MVLLSDRVDALVLVEALVIMANESNNILVTAVSPEAEEAGPAMCPQNMIVIQVEMVQMADY